ncbi:unnamed protein product, partial [marine sediment metagenome]
MGKVLLTYLSEEKRERILEKKGLSHLTKNTIAIESR